MTGLPSDVEVAVVGAGPAGACAALLLARSGRDVLLLDKRQFPRPKPCGDCLSPEAARVLDRLGLLAAVEAAGPARLSGWRIFAPGGRDFAGGFARHAGGDVRASTALALPRSTLDTILLDGARAAGARVATGVRVVDAVRAPDGAITGVLCRTGGGEIRPVRARLVVAADGLRSVLARRLGLVRRAPRLRKVSLTAHLDGIRDLGALGEMHLAPGACIGVARVARGDGATANVTLVVDAAREGRALSRDPGGFLRGALRRFPGLAGRVDPERIRADTPLLASGPFDWPTRGAVLPGAALVGDAAGYYDPFTGQGIFQALATAELLAAEADTALAGPDAPLLGGYARRRRRLLRGARVLQHALEWATSRPAVADRFVALLDGAPAAADALVAATGDLLPVRSLLRPAVLLELLSVPRRRSA